MSIPVPTTIATGFGDAAGCAYQRSADRLLVVDASAGTISAVTAHTHVTTVLGTGYNAPVDIVLSADDLHAYVTENPGSLLRVPLSSANRAAATVVASGLNGVNQIAVDEAHGFAYVLENAARLQKIDLATGVKTVVATAMASPRGVVLTADGRFAYVSDDAGNITRFDFATNTHAVVASGLNGPRFLTWTDATQSAIVFPQPNPVGTVVKLDLTASPPTVTPIAGPTPSAPYSVAFVSAEQLLIVTAQDVCEVDLGAYTGAEPNILLGIGFVPADAAHLPNGYADTSADTTYFFQVKDCPFGGTLPVMINWQQARAAGAQFYQVFIQGSGGLPVRAEAAFADYRLNVDHFDLVTTTPTGGFYPVRAAGDVWLNEWLGLFMDTSAQPNTINTISVKLFSAANAAAEIGSATDAGRHADVMIDNTAPTANLEQILHDGAVVNACAIVNSGSTKFTFRITASAPRHLRGWSLDAYWGDNKSKAIAADDYSHHITGTRLWTGVLSGIVPPPGPAPWNAWVNGDPTSKHCAHTFFLSAWDRVINGWGYIHGAAGYHKSITLLL